VGPQKGKELVLTDASDVDDWSIRQDIAIDQVLDFAREAEEALCLVRLIGSKGKGSGFRNLEIQW
jgi:hypothetical protein